MTQQNMIEAMTPDSRWCILWHREAEKIAAIFSGRRKVFNPYGDDDYPMPPFVFYAPAADVERGRLEGQGASRPDDSHYDARLDSSAFRRDLSTILFVRADKQTTDRLLRAPWTRTLVHRIGTYRGDDGLPVEISGEQLIAFRRTVRQYGFRISFADMGYQEINVGDRVEVVSGPMAGGEASWGIVKEISERGGQLELTITFRLFNSLPVSIPGFSINDVRFLDDTAGDLLHAPLIASFENRLIDCLCHLHGKKGSRQRNQEDLGQLRFLDRYSDIKFEPGSDSAARFAALMLIGAYLMNDKEKQAARQRHVEELLGVLSTPSTEQDCYLMLALFIVTHDPALRRMVKTYRQNHPDCSIALRRFFAIAKQIRC